MSAGWVKFPVGILMDGTLSAAARLLWAYLAHRQGKNGESWPCLETIGHDLGLSKTSAGRAVNELERMGLLQVCHPRRKGRGHHLRYRVNASPMAPAKGPPADRYEEEKGPRMDLSEGKKGPDPAKERSAGGKEQEPEKKNHKQEELKRIKAQVFRQRTAANKTPQEIDQLKQQRLKELSIVASQQVRYGNRTDTTPPIVAPRGGQSPVRM